MAATSLTPWPVTLLGHHKLSEGDLDAPYQSPARGQWLLFEFHTSSWDWGSSRHSSGGPARVTQPQIPPSSGWPPRPVPRAHKGGCRGTLEVGFLGTDWLKSEQFLTQKLHTR